VPAANVEEPRGQLAKGGVEVVARMEVYGGENVVCGIVAFLFSLLLELVYGGSSGMIGRPKIK